MRGLLLAALAIGIWVLLVSPKAGQPESRVVQDNGTTNTEKNTKSNQNQQSTENEAIDGILAQEVLIQQQNAQVLKAEADQTNQEIAVEGKLVKYTWWLVIVG